MGKRETVKINLLICDVDGVMTDGGMYYDMLGNEWKKFNTRDGKGIELLRDTGCRVMILTSEDTDIVRRRAEKLQVDYCFMGIKNKKNELELFYENNPEFSFEKTAYIGDDVNDFDVLQMVGFSTTPADGVEVNKNIVDYICAKCGGAGCVREVCEILIDMNRMAVGE